MNGSTGRRFLFDTFSMPNPFREVLGITGPGSPMENQMAALLGG